MKPYEKWLSQVKTLAAAENTQLPTDDELLAWFNAGHSPSDITDNADFIIAYGN